MSEAGDTDCGRSEKKRRHGLPKAGGTVRIRPAETGGTDRRRAAARSGEGWRHDMATEGGTGWQEGCGAERHIVKIRRGNARFGAWKGRGAATCA